VTNHGDFHGGNIVRAPDGTLKLIDFEYASVTCAAIDFGWSFVMFLDSAADRRSFVEAYLQETTNGQHTLEEVDEVLFDGQIASTTFVLLDQVQRCSEDPGARCMTVCGLDGYSKIASTIEKARANKARRKPIIEQGILSVTSGSCVLS